MSYRQLSFFDLDLLEKEPDVLLKEGQTVYKVIRGDVEELIYIGGTWLYNEGKERGYRLKRVAGCYDCTWNKEIGSVVFFDRKEAETVAAAYLNCHDVIRSSDIHPVNTVAYKYGERTAFYSELDNGCYYMKNFMTYPYLILKENGKKMLKKFMEQKEIATEKATLLTQFSPVYENMYRIRQEYEWDYSVARQTYAIG